MKRLRSTSHLLLLGSALALAGPAPAAAQQPAARPPAAARAEAPPGVPGRDSPTFDIWRGRRGKVRTVEGHLVSLNCYVKHDGHGPEHRTCARVCAEAGLPLGLVDGGGKMYLLIGPGHLPPTEVNKPWLDLVERKLAVTGEFFEEKDLKLVVIQEARPLE